MDSKKITSFFSVNSLSSSENINNTVRNPSICTLPETQSRNSINSGTSSIKSSKHVSRTRINSVQRNKLSLKNRKKFERNTSATKISPRNITPEKHKGTDEESSGVKRLKVGVQNGQKSMFTYLQKKGTLTPTHSTDDGKSNEKENNFKELFHIDVAGGNLNNSTKTAPKLDRTVIFADKGNLMVDESNKLSDDVLTRDRCSVDSLDGMFDETDFLDELDVCFVEDDENEALKGKLDTWIQSINFVKEMKENECFKVTDICRAQKGKICLLLTSEESSVKRICILQGFWLNTFIKEGDIVRVIAEFADGCATINDEAGLLIVNPDQLMSSTTVVSTLFCMRKVVLGEKFPGWGSGGNASMLLGSLIHQLFQEVVQKIDVPTEEDLVEMFSSALKTPGTQHAIYAKKSTELEMESEAATYFSHIINWMRKYLNTSYSEKFNDNEEDAIRVLSVVDIEDNIWCPHYGIRGKIDLTSEIMIHDKRKNAPIELKTGHPSFSFEHQGQVALYSMMMNYRKGNCDEGLLLYLKNGPKMKAISRHYSLQRDLVQLRNDLAHYLSNSSNVSRESSGNHYTMGALPEPINNKRSCQKCPFLLPCTIFQRTIEDKPPNITHAMHLLVPEATKHLSSNHLDYFKHWLLLLQLEQQISHSALHQPFWKQNSLQREKKGLCLANMILCSPERYSKDTWTERNYRYFHTFRKHDANINILNTGFQLYDYIIATIENNSEVLTVATGEILRITKEFVDVTLDRNLYQKPEWSLDIYRLDKMSSNSAMSFNYINLLRLMQDDSIANRARRLLIDRIPPSFVPIPNTKLLKHSILSSLNEQQLNSVTKVLSSSDYLLIKGMPGTGKTSTLVTLVRLLVEMGNSILLTSYTHSALDNILIKLKEHNVDFIRLGRQTRIHNDIKPFSAEIASQKIPNVKELDRFYKSKKVICTTCVGITHPVFQHRNFDICIVDEASQVLQTACIGPLLHAKKFVLVGDPQQLPPVVQSKEARSLGMSESLFSRLQTKQNTVELNVQYRMNKEITRLCNALTYDGMLKCSSPVVECATLHLHNINMLSDIFSWHKSVLSARLCDAALFLNTDCIPGTENYDSQGLVQNETEVQIITQLIWTMVKAGIPEQDVGVISPYKKQVQMLQGSLNAREISRIEVNTVDQYQGRDKAVIVISCVRSSTRKKVAEILEDERRLNVAISRAKHKLLIVGSKSTLLDYTPFHKLIMALREKQIINVPKDNIANFWKWTDELHTPINSTSSYFETTRK